MFHNRSAQRARRWIATAILLSLATATHAAAATTPLAATSWSGRAIQEPEPRQVKTGSRPAWPKGWSAGPVRFKTGYACSRRIAPRPGSSGTARWRAATVRDHAMGAGARVRATR